MGKFKYFKKTTSHIHGDITLSPIQFRLLSLVDENKKIGLIARESGLDPLSFKEEIKKLYEMGLIAPVVKKSVKRYGSEFSTELTTILAHHAGPVANIILTDVLSEMKITENKIPVNNLNQVVSKISDEIFDPKQKSAFYSDVAKLLSRTYK